MTTPPEQVDALIQALPLGLSLSHPSLPLGLSLSHTPLAQVDALIQMVADEAGLQVGGWMRARRAWSSRLPPVDDRAY